jgi:hypothetical protein
MSSFSFRADQGWEELKIQEHFLDFLPVEQTSGEELTKAIL